jgi:hypothetical protein
MEKVMRKIEREMLEAISLKTDWSKDNTRVNQYRGIANIYLYDNWIAQHVYATKYEYARTSPLTVTFKEWPTTTTRSRLRALGINASIRKGKACIDGVEL